MRSIGFFAAAVFFALSISSAGFSNKIEKFRIAQNLAKSQPVQIQIIDLIKAGKTTSAKLQLSLGFTPEESEIARKISEREWDQSWQILENAFATQFSKSMSTEQIGLTIQSIENAQLQNRSDKIRVVLPTGMPEVERVRKIIEATIRRKQRVEIGK